MHEECLMFEGFYVSIYRAVICSCIGKLLLESVFPALLNGKMHFAAIFTQLDGKWKLHDVKISVPNDLFTKRNVQGSLQVVWEALSVKISWAYASLCLLC